MEPLFLRLPRKLLKRGEKDKVVWMGPKNSVFSIKSLYSMLESRCSIFFLEVII